MKSNTSVSDALQWGIGELKKAGVDTPVLDAEVILAHVLQSPSRTTGRLSRNIKDRGWIYAHSEQHISRTAGPQFIKLIRRRMRREPVAYIVGHKEFYGLDFLVNRNVLVPRPETEVLIERVNYEITKLRNYERRNLTVVDVGTGSGAIVVALAKNTPSVPPPLRGRIKVGGVHFFATDISPATLRVARQNARRNGVVDRVTLLRGNLLDPVFFHLMNTPSNSPSERGRSESISSPRSTAGRGGSYQFVIVANLPYLPTSEWRATAPEVRKWEPRGALDGGKDGLKYYRELFHQLSDVSSWLSATILCEICPEQAQSFKKMVKSYFSKAKFEVVKDLSGRNRVVAVKFFKK